MRRRTAGFAATGVALLVAVVLVGGQLLAGAGSQTPRLSISSPAAATQSAEDECEQADDEECGNQHSRAVRAWVHCKATKGKDACTKPQPPGRAVGHTKRAGNAPGPASADGRGHAWGRAHAPGQLKVRHQPD